MKILNKFKISLKQITIIFGVVIILLEISGCSASRPDNLGLKNNLLLSCPESPNCVLSQQSDEKHRIQPLAYTGSLEVAKERLSQVILSLENTRIIIQNRDYWHVEFTSRWLRFIDDVEFYFVESEPLIHLRSASRLGYYDFGANQKRVEKIRTRFEKLENGS
jgi:uncharacterized protein (DUF1499 family)|tara:strand:- start:155 stop:643 length:489 start_codon:yes stop_codon:yes gene_type:complete